MTPGSWRRRGLRPALLIGAGVLLALAAVWSAVRPVVIPLTQRAALATQARDTSSGIPLPLLAHPCASQASATGGVARWCLPGDVSVRTVERWYDGVLPPGQSEGTLRWCVSQTQSDGTRRSLWTRGAGLVGYDLPPSTPRQGAARGVVIGVVALPHRSCPAAARSTRTAAGA